MDASAGSNVEPPTTQSLRQHLARECRSQWFRVILLVYAVAAALTVALALAGVTDAVGYLASLFVLGSFASRAMMPLRLLAALSNIAFIVYASQHHLPPVLVLHALLLPVNLLRIAQLTGLAEVLRQALRPRHAWARRPRAARAREGAV
jgi:hypothetical protein